LVGVCRGRRERNFFTGPKGKRKKEITNVKGTGSGERKARRQDPTGCPQPRKKKNQPGVLRRGGGAGFA